MLSRPERSWECPMVGRSPECSTTNPKIAKMRKKGGLTHKLSYTLYCVLQIAEQNSRLPERNSVAVVVSIPQLLQLASCRPVMMNTD